jgi:hypothetical protein
MVGMTGNTSGTLSVKFLFKRVFIGFPLVF